MSTTEPSKKDKKKDDKDVGHHSSGSHDTLSQDVCLFLFMMMLIGQVMKQFAAFSGIPFTSLITVIGLGLGMLT